jgi:hypothetical protein
VATEPTPRTRAGTVRPTLIAGRGAHWLDRRWLVGYRTRRCSAPRRRPVPPGSGTCRHWRSPRLLRGAVNGPEAVLCCPSSCVRGGRKPWATYHGTTRNRCADRHIRRSRPTVRAEVIGSPSTRLCAHFRSCCSPQRRAIPDQRSPNSAPCPFLDRSLAIRSVDGVSRGSSRGRRATTSRRRRPPGGSPRRQPQPASRGSRALATHGRRSAVPVAAGAEPDAPGQGTSRPETASPRTSTCPTRPTGCPR